MNKEQYTKKRNALIKDAEKLINDGKLDEANAKTAEIEALDAKQDEINRARANFNAMNYNGEIPQAAIDIMKGNGTIKVAEEQQKTILNKADKWPVKENKQLDAGKWFKGVVTGKWDSVDLKNSLTTTSTGVLIPEALSSRIIDKARNISLFTQAGVPIAPMTSNSLTFAKVKTDPSMGFKEEGAAASESTMELEGVELKAKMIYGYAYITLEAINSGVNLQDVVINTFSQALAQGIDNAYLNGQANETGFDTFAPDGILNSTDINSITATDNGYDDIVKAISKVKQNNGTPTAWGMNALTEEFYSLKKDNNNNYLAAPKMVDDLGQIVSNQLPHSETDGETSLIFDPQALIIGMQEGINIKIIDTTDEGLTKGKIAVRVYAMVDAKLLQPKHVCKVVKINKPVA